MPNGVGVNTAKFGDYFNSSVENSKDQLLQIDPESSKGVLYGANDTTRMDIEGRIFSEVGDDIDPSKSTYVSQQQIAQQIVNNSLRQITSNPKDNRAVEALTGTNPNKFRQTADKLKQLAGGAIETIGNKFNDLSPKPKEQTSTETQTLLQEAMLNLRVPDQLIDQLNLLLTILLIQG